MNANDQRHKGFHAYKVDPKYRISIPTAWRPEAGGVLYLLFSNEYDMPVVKVLSEEAYGERVERIRASDKTPAEKSGLLGRLAMLCREATLNDQGKLLIPKDLSEKAGIVAEGSVTLVGRGIHFEIWNKENFEAMLAITNAEKQHDDLGIF